MLPEKWYVKRTMDNSSHVNGWFNRTIGTNYKSANGYLYFPSFHGPALYNAQEKGYLYFPSFHGPALYNAQEKGYAEISYEELARENKLPQISVNYEIY